MDVDVVLTGRQGAPWPIAADPAQVHQVGFLPLDQLLAGVELVVLAGGSGTLAAVFSRGLLMVVSPMVFDQYANAGRAAATGAAVIATDPADVGRRVHEVLVDPSYRTRATALAAEISAMDSLSAAWARVLARVPGQAHARTSDTS